MFEFVIFELYALLPWFCQYALQIALVTVAYSQKTEFDQTKLESIFCHGHCDCMALSLTRFTFCVTGHKI